MAEQNMTPDTEEILEQQPQAAEEAPAAEGDKKKSKKKDSSKARIAELEAEVASFGEKVAELNDRLLRTAAEFDNYRRRTENEKRAANGNGVASAVERILPALDTLEIAAAAESTDENYKKGVLMTLGIFRSNLESMGVKEIEAEGRSFDPNFHSAVAQEASELESGTITKVMQKGYMLGDRVIRPSMVVVAE